MARRQKQPEGRRKSAGKTTTKRARVLPVIGALAARGGSALGRRIAANPSLAAGATAFAVVFSFVAANALWYQNGTHPSPLMATRDGFVPRAPDPALERSPPGENRIAGLAGETERAVDSERQVSSEPPPEAEANADAGMEASEPETIDDILAPVPSRRVQSVRFSREDIETMTASIPPADDPAQAAPADDASDEDARDGEPEPDPLIRGIQRELARIGIYGGAVDGLTGPMTRAALAKYAELSGREGRAPAPDEDLLARLKRTDRAGLQAAAETQAPENAGPESADIADAERPQPASARPRQDDHNAARRREANLYIPPADVPVSTGGASDQPSALVRDIQKGLVNMAYSDVEIDGVVGAKTRGAIRHFERHYRLPETGEPSRRVLDKLRDIGAL